MDDKGPPTDIDVTIDTTVDLEVITLTFMSKDGEVKVGFSIDEAQMLVHYLNEAVSTIILRKLELAPVPDLPEDEPTKH